MRKIFDYLLKFMMSRIFMIAMIMVLQLALVILSLYSFSLTSQVTRTLFLVLNIIITIYIVNRNVNTSYKLAWIILINFIPVVGGVIYLMFAEQKIPKSLRKEITRNLMYGKNVYRKYVSEDINIDSADISQQFNYVKNNAYYPYYKNTKVRYFPSGETYFDDLIKHLKKAKHFIFLEFFIVKEGKMLSEITEVLKEKVKEGVEVYFMYDDGGSITCLPKDFENTMRSYGINIVAFNPVSTFLVFLSKANNRDHRKICVIDNEYGYMGGLNIADEYINAIERFGHWKDTAISLRGEAVSSLTVMFIQFYNVFAKEKLKYDDFMLKSRKVTSNSIVLPFSDSPTDDEDVARTVHINLINKAKKYIYIHTPYLILDYDMTHALMTAAKQGVEVIITVPKIPDKKTVFMVTRSNYEVLLKAGVKIYEYTPGFIHSKLFVSDDNIALCGTINMDYRSYYLHYECGTLIAFDNEIMKMKADYLATLKESEEITLEKVQKTNIIIRIAQAILAVFAPIF